jgi:putative membrane protein
MGWLLRNTIKLVVVGLVVFWLTEFIDGIHIASVSVAILLALVLALLNVFVRPIIKLITLPINIVTLGLFSFVINMLLFWAAGSLIDGVQIDGWIPALLGSLAVSFVSWLYDFFFNR